MSRTTDLAWGSHSYPMFSDPTVECRQLRLGPQCRLPVPHMVGWSRRQQSPVAEEIQVRAASPCSSPREGRVRWSPATIPDTAFALATALRKAKSLKPTLRVPPCAAPWAAQGAKGSPSNKSSVRPGAAHPAQQQTWRSNLRGGLTIADIKNNVNRLKLPPARLVDAGPRASHAGSLLLLPSRGLSMRDGAYKIYDKFTLFRGELW
jgi:hypothetical protein